MDKKNIIPHPKTSTLSIRFKQIRDLISAVTTMLNVVGTVLIIMVMLLVNSDVIGRGFFDAPISGVPEMVSMSIVAIVFLQVPQAFRKGNLTRTDAVLNFIYVYSPKAVKALSLIFSVAALLLIWQLFSASLPLFKKAWIRNTYEGTVGDFTAPIWPVKLVILIGCFVLMIQIVLYAIDVLIAPSQSTKDDK